ncbi:hypothetical protein [Halomarina ordinaria]|uniref:Uncharacterized protein n=1 Tax=Halomarina ordinaria TaxID=3033939 RepID=A0ABD5U835_9EURY|nr:hypothetical protein [Halomarina sp. PSRA2]
MATEALLFGLFLAVAVGGSLALYAFVSEERERREVAATDWESAERAARRDTRDGREGRDGR